MICGKTISINIHTLCDENGATVLFNYLFRLMRAVADHTRVGPTERIQKYLAFNARLQQSKECQKHFEDWGFKPDTNLVRVQGRVLERETILLGDKRQ